MKRALFIAFGLAGTICVVFFVMSLSKKSTVLQSAQVPPSGAQPCSEPVKHNSLQPESKSPPDAVTTQPLSEERVPHDLKGVTIDPAVIEFWSSRRPQEVGEVRPTETESQQLWINGRMVFEATAIKNVRSMAQDGTIALAAVTDEPLPAAPKHEIAGSERPSRIWLVDAGGNKKQVSPPAIDASRPLISPSGRFVAFTGSRSGGIEPFAGNQLFVVDVENGHSRTYNTNQPLEHYSVTAVEWSDDEKLIKIIEDHGETGGHMVMRQIRLDN